MRPSDDEMIMYTDPDGLTHKADIACHFDIALARLRDARWVVVDEDQLGRPDLYCAPEYHPHRKISAVLRTISKDFVSKKSELAIEEKGVGLLMRQAAHNCRHITHHVLVCRREGRFWQIGEERFHNNVLCRAEHAGYNLAACRSRESLKRLGQNGGQRTKLGEEPACQRVGAIRFKGPDHVRQGGMLTPERDLR